MAKQAGAGSGVGDVFASALQPRRTSGSERDATTPADDDPDVDNAKALVSGQPDSKVEVDSLAERRLVRKIDCLIIPIMFVCYGLQYYDKAILGSAAVAGLLEDLHLETPVPPRHPGEPGRTSLSRFSWATALFYFGGLAGVFPSAWLCQKLPLAKFLAVMVFIWSSIVLLTVTCSSYQGLYANRFFLGVAEACSAPGFLLITSMWYRKNEAVIRIGPWYAATGVTACFASLLNYAIGHVDGALSPWKYLVAGSVTFVWGGFVWLFLPDSPARSTRWLTLEERRMAVQRVKANLTGVENKHFKYYQVVEGLLDVQIWLHFLMIICIYICNGGVTSFGSIIIKSFNYTALQSILLFSPAGPATVLSIAICSLLAYRIPDSRTLLIPLACFPVIAGAAMVWRGDWADRAVPLAGIYLVSSFGGAMVLTLSLAAANVAGHTKKAFSAGSLFAAYNIGNIIAPYTIIGQEKDVHFRSTWIAIIVSMSACSAMSLLLRLVLSRRNRSRALSSGKKAGDDGDALAAGKTAAAAKALETALDDRTDRENPFFTYIL